MQKEEIAKCTELAKKYFSFKDKEQEAIRNELYFCLKQYMLKWMKTILSTKGLYWEANELLSESWLCFEFCLRHFKPEGCIPLPNHFYAYSKFYIASIKNSQNKKHLLHDEYKEHVDYMSMEGEDLNSVYEQLDELRCFKKSLPKEYYSIFDDAVMSMVGCLNDRVRRLGETPVKYYRYCESKKIFRITIDYLLRR